MSRNPFHLKTLGPEQAFCNRSREQESLFRDAANGMNVVLFAPRRYGKTSLVRRVQNRLKSEAGHCVVYCDLFKLMSVDDLAERLAKAIFKGLHEHMSLLDKGKRFLALFPSFTVNMSLGQDGSPTLGVEPVQRRQEPLARLESLMEDIGRFLKKESMPITLALDEFQDIVDLKEPRIEAILREHIQHHRAAYIFLGSRRRLLKDIFTNQGRPFYQSATMMELPPLPAAELAEFISSQFSSAGKYCPRDLALELVGCIEGYPYYAQALAYRAFNLCDTACTRDILDQALESLLSSEHYGYEAVVQALSANRMKLFLAIAREPGARLSASAFLNEHRLTAGGVQHATAHLADQDLIEKDETGWKVVDPLLRDWMLRTF